MRKLLCFVFFIFLIFQLSACDSNNSAQIVKNNVPHDYIEQSVYPIDYYNKDYNYSLLFPNSWKNFLAESRTFDICPNAIEDTIFKLNNDQIFNITVFPKETWETAKIETYGSQATEIISTDKYVFVYKVNNLIEKPTVKKAMTDVDGIISSFQIVQ